MTLKMKENVESVRSFLNIISFLHPNNQFLKMSAFATSEMKGRLGCVFLSQRFLGSLQGTHYTELE